MPFDERFKNALKAVFFETATDSVFVYAAKETLINLKEQLHCNKTFLLVCPIDATLLTQKLAKDFS